MANPHSIISLARNSNDTATTGKKAINGGRSAAPENSGVGLCERALKRNNGPAVYWSPDDQALLEELLIKYASDSIVKRYAKIVLKMPHKTLDDVALRSRWMIERENRKRMKDNSNSSRRHKDKKEKAACQQVKPSSCATNHSNGLHYAQLSTSIGSDECIGDEVSYKAIGAAALQLLEQKDQALNQISAHVSASKEKENGKRMKDNSNSSRRNKDKKKKAAYQQVKPSSHATNHSNALHHSQLSTSIDNDEDIDDEMSYKAIGGAAAKLLEQNNQALNQFSANVSAFKLHENSYLKHQMMNNINALLYESLHDPPEIKQSARQLYDLPFVMRLKKV